MGSYQSKEEEVHKISTSVFVTNFPDLFCAKDLWNTCNQYGHVVDAYIPNMRSKAGKRFSFVRFIKVFDVECLVNNLCTVWVGCHKLHANIPRFHKEPLNKHSNLHNDNGVKKGKLGADYNDKGVKGTSNSYVHVIKEYQHSIVDTDVNPVLVLDDACLNQKDYSLCLMGKVTKFASLSNLKVFLVNEGFNNIKLKYMGGYWVMIEFQSEEAKKSFRVNTGMGAWFSQIQQVSYDFIIDGRVTWVEVEGILLKMWSENTFRHVASKWDVLLDMDDQEDGCYHRKRIC
ncbi:nucleotide-binding alpha-beta plait domain-containing protein [Tanacetum coccineum]